LCERGCVPIPLLNPADFSDHLRLRSEGPLCDTRVLRLREITSCCLFCYWRWSHSPRVRPTFKGAGQHCRLLCRSTQFTWHFLTRVKFLLSLVPAMLHSIRITRLLSGIRKQTRSRPNL